MITKELFVKTLVAIDNQLKADREFAENLSKAFKFAFEPNLLPDNHYLANALIELLQTIFNDNDADSWIEWWIFENDFGRNNLEVRVKDVAVELKNNDDFYDFLMN
jgi:hypothetical protein